MIIQMKKNTKHKLKEYGSGNFDEVVNQLISDVEDDMIVFPVDYSPISTMRLKESTIRRLKSFALTDGESYENIILRMLAQSLYSSPE